MMNNINDEISFIRQKLGSVQEIELISETKNRVYKVKAEKKVYLFKLLSLQSSLINNNESAIYKYLSHSAFIRNCVGKSSEDEDVQYVITEYVEGCTLIELLKQDVDIQKYMEDIYMYLEDCREIQVEGFGPLHSGLKGNFDSWYKFLQAYLRDALSQLNTLQPTSSLKKMKEIHDFLSNYLESNQTYFQGVKPTLIPIDLNLSNFLVTDSDKLLVLDLDAFWGGDALLAIGEFVGHSYGMEYYYPFIEMYSHLLPEERSIIHFYAILSNFDVLKYILFNSIENIEDSAPWGNRATFLELVNTHRSLLEREFLFSSSYFLSTNPFLENNPGKKMSLSQQRTVSPEVTLSRVEPIQHLAGITRVPDITGLDSIGITAYQCVRPDAEEEEETFTVFSGKGSTKEQCKVSAIVEGIERFCAERKNYSSERIIADSYIQLKKRCKVVHPQEFNMPKEAGFLEDEILEWTKAVNLFTGESYYIPANTVFYPYKPEKGRMLFRYFTTGLAAGNTIIECMSHGLAEVIERDSAALNLLLRNYPTVPLESITHSALADQIRKIKSAYSNLNLIIRYISAPDIKVPVFSVLIEDLDLLDPMYVSGGYGAHPNKDVALMTALNEAALSRVSTISGAREDLKKFQDKKQKMPYSDYKQKYKYWFSQEKQLHYSEIPSFHFSSALEDFTYMANNIKTAGFDKILLVDLTNPLLEFPVIKVLVPGVERYSFRMQCIGERARNFYKQLYNRELEK